MVLQKLRFVARRRLLECLATHKICGIRTMSYFLVVMSFIVPDLQVREPTGQKKPSGARARGVEGIFLESLPLFNAETTMYEVWLKSNGTGRPADMVEDPQTNETHDINL